MSISSLQLFRLLCLAAMYIGAVTQVLFVLGSVGQGAAQPARWPQLTAGLLLAFVVDRGLLRLPRSWRAFSWLLLGLLAIVLLLKSLLGGGLTPLAGWSTMVPRDYPAYQELLFGTLALLYLWSRGARLAELDYDDVSGFFRRGIIALLIGLPVLQLLFQAPLGAPQVLSRITLYLLIFMASGLLALTSSTVIGREHSAGRQRWIAGTVLPVLLLLGLGLGLSALFSEGLRHVMAQVLDVVLATLYWLLAPLAILLTAVLGWLLEQLIPPPGDVSPTPAPTPVGTPGPLEQLLPAYPPPPPAWAAPLWRSLGLLILLAIVVLALRWMLKRVRRESVELEVERSSVWSWSQLQSDLRDMLGGLSARFRRQGLRAALAALRGQDPAARIRRAYIRLLLLGEEHEHSRPHSATPREYQPLAEELAPDARAQVGLLTEAYEEARYGPLPQPARAEAAERAIQQIDTAIRRGERRGPAQ